VYPHYRSADLYSVAYELDVQMHLVPAPL
jgi:hypothetical protein